MANLATLDLATTLQDSAKMIACARVLLSHVDRPSLLPYQKPFRHITDYMIGELEKCAVAVNQFQWLKLAAATRNLFELSLTVDFVCAADQNMDQFIADAAIDELEMMEKFLAIDKQDSSYQPDQKSQERTQRLKDQIAQADRTGHRPLQPLDIAKAVNREAEYHEVYRVYSKMTHATAWAILGDCSWDNMALWLLRRANRYAEECVKQIAGKTGLPANTPVPRV